MPAIHDDRANAVSLVRATLIPAAAAARSLERMAIIVRPVGERRNRAIMTPTRHTIASTRTPKMMRG